jgi:hypothetical protein
VKSWIQTSVLPKKNKSQKHKHRPGSGVSLLILLATQEAEIGRIAIPTHPWANNSQKWEKCQVPVAHACNPSYSEDRDLENLGSKPAQANILSYNSSLSYIMIACSCGLWMALKISSMLCSLFLPVFLCHSLTMIVQQILFFLWYSMLFKKNYCSTGTWTQGLHLEPLHQPLFVMGFFNTGSHELFSLAGLEPKSSWSLPPQ